MRFHVGAEDGVDTGLVSAFAAKPAEQVGIQAHGHDFFRSRQGDFSGLPEFRIRGVGFGIGADAFANLGWRPPAETAPVGRPRRFVPRIFVVVVPLVLILIGAAP